MKTQTSDHEDSNPENSDPVNSAAAGNQAYVFSKSTVLGPILYLHKSHNTPLLPQKICIGIGLDFSRDIFMSQEKLQTMITQKNFWGEGGQGVKELYYRICAK